MTVYARSDVASIALSPAHGGCGEVHARPAPGGKPDAVWALECPACEDHLRHDPLWAATPVDVPETPDETRVREDKEKRGEQERLSAIGGYLAADQEFKQMFLQMIGNMGGQGVVAGQVECPAGHANPPGGKFCGECGAPLGQAEVLDAPAAEAPAEPAAAGPACADCGAPIVRKPGQRGALPKRCDACKGK